MAPAQGWHARIEKCKQLNQLINLETLHVPTPESSLLREPSWKHNSLAGLLRDTPSSISCVLHSGRALEARREGLRPPAISATLPLRSRAWCCCFGCFGCFGCLCWAVTLIPIPLPKRVLQTSDCTHFFYEQILQTILGVDMGMNVTAHRLPPPTGRGRSWKGKRREEREEPWQPLLPLPLPPAVLQASYVGRRKRQRLARS